jgi:hypothetical protein
MRLLCLLLASGLAASVAGAEPCISGPQVGQRPGPYSFLVATGPQRGQQTCYVCETAEKPGVIVFARSLSEPLKKVLVACDEAMAARPKDALRGWMTVLGEKSAGLDELAKWAKNGGLKAMHVGIFDDPVGPPSYRLANDADVTVLLFADKKVVANLAFRNGELNDDAVKAIAAKLAQHGLKK